MVRRKSIDELEPVLVVGKVAVPGVSVTGLAEAEVPMPERSMAMLGLGELLPRTKYAVRGPVAAGENDIW